MNVIKQCEVCDCALILEGADKRRLEFTAHTQEMCAAGVRIKIDALTRAIRSESENAALQTVRMYRQARHADMHRRVLAELVDAIDLAGGVLTAPRLILTALSAAKEVLDDPDRVLREQDKAGQARAEAALAAAKLDD